MGIAFECEACRERVVAPDTAAGKRARCPRCAAVQVVPALPAVAPKPAPPGALAQVRSAAQRAVNAARTLARPPAPAARGELLPAEPATLETRAMPYAPPERLPPIVAERVGPPAAPQPPPALPQPQVIYVQAPPAISITNTATATAGGGGPRNALASCALLLGMAAFALGFATPWALLPALVGALCAVGGFVLGVFRFAGVGYALLGGLLCLAAILVAGANAARSELPPRPPASATR